MAETIELSATAFHIMAKPAGALCNLDCAYCYYLEKERLYPSPDARRMSDEVLETFIRDYIASQPTEEVNFAWQGGEPTALGLAFFEKVVALQDRYAGGKTIRNALQTNGVLLDDEWCRFLARHQFLIGVSIDGPAHIHDAYRKDKGGRPTFDRVLRSIERMKRFNVEFNTLTCVHRQNQRRPLEVYRFLREIGSGFMQFIPVVERMADAATGADLSLVSPDSRVEAHVTPWSVTPADFGRFLSAIFDEWVRHDVGRVYVQLFDIALQAWLGMEPALCVFAKTCGNAMVLEHKGDLYACDHYVYPENRVGNIMERPLRDLARSQSQIAFGLAKHADLPSCCRKCPVLFACNGECPKHRFAAAPNGEPGLSYLCEGYKRFYMHVAPYMQFMADELRAGRPPANIMHRVRQADLIERSGSRPSANDSCPCGSGRKFKKCCGRNA
ncbi:MAG: anaerobic sulfatase maturase [Candidatus Hydrogenedentota bacterium]